MLAVLNVVAALTGGVGVAPASSDTIAVHVRIDSARGQVVLTAGPWMVMPSSGTGQMQMDHAGSAPTRFNWPVNGWVHALEFRARTGDGRPVPRASLHHLALLNLSRRDLFYPIPERLFEMGRETTDIELPDSVGIAVSAGMPMALSVMWMSDGDSTLADVSIELVIRWTPAGASPAPISARFVTMQEIDSRGDVSFDLPPGDQRFATDYRMPLSGRILAAGGHLHDYGKEVALRDVAAPSSPLVLRLQSKRDAAGHVTAVERQWPRDGIPLRAGRVYRLEGYYQNTSGATVPRGGMVYLVMLFVPGD